MPSRRRIAIIAAAVALVLFAGVWWVFGMPMPPFGPWRYVGSAQSDRYHEPSCVWVQHLEPSRRAYFSSAEAAEAREYRPCQTCVGP